VGGCGTDRVGPNEVAFDLLRRRATVLGGGAYSHRRMSLKAGGEGGSGLGSFPCCFERKKNNRRVSFDARVDDYIKGYDRDGSRLRFCNFFSQRSSIFPAHTSHDGKSYRVEPTKLAVAGIGDVNLPRYVRDQDRSVQCNYSRFLIRI